MILNTNSCKMLANIAQDRIIYYSCHRKFIMHHGLANISEQKKKDIEAKQKEMMARGLPNKKPIPGVKQIVIVASGKGGVGKSTTAVNLAVGLKSSYPTKSVGLLDADVFGPSIPLMMNLHESPLLTEDRLMEPLVNYGVKCMSMGFLIEDNQSAIWRGLMVMSAINKLLYGVAWGPLDYLVIDTPPGTGDTHLSLIQNLPISGALLVTTPQKAAVDVTRRGASIFQKMNVPVVGIVENMSNISCPNCNNRIKLFGRGIDHVAQELGIEILQQIPLSDTITDSADTGKPIVLTSTNNILTNTYKNLAKQVATFLDELREKRE